jgi:hypothetical protein
MDPKPTTLKPEKSKKKNRPNQPAAQKNISQQVN